MAAGFGVVILCLAAMTLTAWIDESTRLEHLRAKHRKQEKINARLRKKIDERNQQLKQIAGKLNTLENRMGQLAQFEKKIRTISGVDHMPEQFANFGVGGAMPDGIASVDSVSKRQINRVQCLNSRVEGLKHTAAQRSHSLQALYELLKTQQELLAVTPSIRPVDGGWVSSSFGSRKSPFTGQNEYHTGVDIAIRAGSPVKATADGIVKFAGISGSLGKFVILDHGYGITSRYGHLGALNVSKQQRVQKADVIAESGNSGRSTGPHLHYEVRFNGIPINAEKYMPEYLAGNNEY